MERYVEEFVWQIKGGGGAVAEAQPTCAQGFAGVWENTREIVGKVWLYVVIGIAVGAGIHGYVPEDALAGILGEGAWWSVPAAVAIGVPLYSNIAGVILVVQALMAKGAALGTVLAFMMAVVALSLPELTSCAACSSRACSPPSSASWPVASSPLATCSICSFEGFC
jgi:uncharacterized membrane protein YraQ (UPF0718 family)